MSGASYQHLLNPYEVSGKSLDHLYTLSHLILIPLSQGSIISCSTNPHLLMSKSILFRIKIGLYSAHMMGLSSLKAGGHFSPTCLLRSYLPSPGYWLCQLLLSLHLVSSKMHPPAYRNLLTPQMCHDLLSPRSPAICLSLPSEQLSGFLFLLCFVKEAWTRTRPWEWHSKLGMCIIPSDTRKIPRTSYVKFK